ncbi:MAG: hypothetical protein M1165_01325 [Candidatus Pacearchaeota archaeon]|nr:hypothetical protein [Candidatus Pacearchaeota archaeon]
MSWDEFDFGISFFCWYRILGNSDMVPTSDNELDRAMKKAVDSGRYDSIAEFLHFSNTRTCLRCVELPSLERTAINSQIICYAPENYKSDRILISQRVAERILQRYDNVPDMEEFVSEVLTSLSQN